MSGMTESDFRLLYSVQSLKQWYSACKTIKQRHGGEYPNDWYQAVNESGLMGVIMNRVNRAKTKGTAEALRDGVGHVREKLSGEKVPRRGSSTPWGKAQDVVKVAEGIWHVKAEHNSGYVLDRERNREIPESIKNASHDPLVQRGWYETSSNAAAVEFTFPEHFKSNGAVGDVWIVRQMAFLKLGVPVESQASRQLQYKLFRDLQTRREEVGNPRGKEGFTTGAFANGRGPEHGMLTPYGVLCHVEKVAEGIWRADAAGDGGYYVDTRRNALVSRELLVGAEPIAEDGWYRERSDAAIVEYSFPEHFRHSSEERLEWVADRIGLIKERDAIARSSSNVLQELIARRTKVHER